MLVSVDLNSAPNQLDFIDNHKFELEKDVMIDTAVPIGAIVAYSGLEKTVPVNWMVCKGQKLDATKKELKPLFDAIRNSWGGDGVTTFYLPDFQGLFLRGVDGGTGRDPDAGKRTASNTGGLTGSNVGTIQPDAFQSHRHSDGTHTHPFADRAQGGEQFAGGGPDFQAMRTPTEIRRNTDPSGANVTEPSPAPGQTISVSAETRPKNAYVFWIIRAH